jgi:hypothetical protein
MIPEAGRFIIFGAVWTKNNSSLLANFAYARLSWGWNNHLEKEKGIWLLI